MKKLALIVLMTLIASAPACAETTADISTVDVAASVEVHAAPDIAQISAGVVTTAPTAAAALADNAARMTKVAGALKDAGIAGKDIQTVGINVSAQYAYQDGHAPRVTGYQASNTVNVVLHDLTAAGKVLDALVASGANSIGGPSFSVENPDALLDKARTEAVHKAQARADLYAAAAGMKVKRLVTLSEEAQNSFQPPRPMMMKAMAMEAAASTPVSPGELELSVTVHARYELAQ